MRILYLTHDLDDPATARRVRMLQVGGANVHVMGFRRHTDVVVRVADCTATDLGRTYSGRFLQRGASVVRVVAAIQRQRERFASADVVVARNLEMLAIAVWGRALCGSASALVYECLDIHRLLLRGDAVGQALRALEGWLARRASLLITSSPAFVCEYFEKRSRVRLPVLLLQNKVFTKPAPEPSSVSVGVVDRRQHGPPWRIGWFGAIRCRRSLALLCAIARDNPRLVEVIIRGRPAYDEVVDFDDQVANTPGVTFLGPYRNPEDLEAIYRDVHFTWTIDMFEEGLNSTWLLPNRVYEGGRFGAVPLAGEGVETSRFLANLGVGHSLTEPKAAALLNFLAGLTHERYRAMQAAVDAVAPEVWECGPEDCVALVARLGLLVRSREKH